MSYYKTEDVEPPLEGFTPTRPKHYGGESNPFEPIKVIRYYKLNFFLGNVIKYVLRAGKKDPNKTIEDLEKAAFYINKEIEYLKTELKKD